MTAAVHSITGGCQCGAVRFSCEGLGRASICHCRMCQKAFGGFFGPLVTAIGLTWTRGNPSHFRSSNRVLRGFCANCGTPMTFEMDGTADVDVAIGAFDRPGEIVPVVQMVLQAKLPYVDTIGDLPDLTDAEKQKFADYYASIISYQHPDHET
jgi:hypothetical protein